MQMSSPDNFLGKNQSWQDVKASRSGGVTYTNTTGKPIMVCINLDLFSSHTFEFHIEGNRVARSSASSTQYRVVLSYVILPGETYSLAIATGLGISDWEELR